MPPKVAVAPPPVSAEPVSPTEPPFPPAPWAIAADAPSERGFERHELEGGTVWATCYKYAWGGCLQPEFAIEREGRLEPTKALAQGMPKLEYIDLRKEPEKHWKVVGHKAPRRLEESCKVDTYVGPRMMTGLYGHFPDDLWMTVDRSGEEPAMSSVTTVYRFQGTEWKAVRTQSKLGDRVVEMYRYRGGMLGLVERQGMAARFETYGTPPGVVAPQIPPDLQFRKLVVRDDGSMIADVSTFQVMLLGWGPRAPRPARITLRVDGDSKLVFLPNGDVDLFGSGELPVDVKVHGDFALEKLHAKLRFQGGRWKVVEQKAEAWSADPEPAKPEGVAALEADERFMLSESFSAPDGSSWAVGSMRDGGPALLLHNRPIADVWHVSDAQLVAVPDEQVPNCTPIHLAPGLQP